MMRKKAVLYLCAVIAVALLMWNLCKGPPIRDIKDVFGIPKAATVQTRTPKTSPKCNLSRNCSFDHFPFSITSGAADVVGPKICFDGKIVLSHVLNNVGPGMNIVLVNGKNGKIETTDFFNLNYNQPKESAAYLRAIKPGTIVLVASFGDISTIMTDEVSDIFLGLGSSLVKSLKGRDNWVFAGYSGTEMKSLFERMAVNDAKTNPYGEWPGVVELGGCFPRKA